MTRRGPESADIRRMIDKLLWGALKGVIMTLISVLAACALVCAHTGVLRLCCGGTRAGVGLLGVAGALVGAACLMIKHRNDLVDR